MKDQLITYLPWVLSCITIWMTWAAGSQKKGAWAIGLMAQSLWLLWILLTKTWGLLPMNAALWVVYTRNHMRWNKPKPAHNEQALSELVDGIWKDLNSKTAPHTIYSKLTPEEIAAAERQIDAHLPRSRGCKLPPAGMFCTREPGHEGPCPTYPGSGA